MKTISVPFFTPDNARQETFPLHAIDIEPWAAAGGASCEAGFSIFHYDKGIGIRYQVEEPFLRAKKRKINEAVHKDNCVEFFIGFGEEKAYYNFEFNCFGSVKAAFGEGRQHRRFLPPNLLRPVQESMTLAMDNASGRIRWSLAMLLPMDTFLFHHKKVFSGLSCFANFAKCGDDLPEPHFLSWVNLVSKQPDFHRPQSFGRLEFEPKTAGPGN